MKKLLLVLVAVIFLAGVSWGQEEAFKPRGAVSFELGGAILAPVGVGVEFFLGHLGLGGELRFLFAGFGGVFGAVIDPGVAVRYYFADVDSSLYLMGGLSYLTAFAVGAGGGGTSPVSWLKPKAGIGYQALFGKNNRIRFAAELGAVYLIFMTRGDIVNLDMIWFPLLPHGLIMFGYAF